jgi:hypothetical protein
MVLAMSLQLIARGPMITTAAAAKKLAPIHRDQLLAALASYFGKKTSFAAAFPADEPAEAQRYEVATPWGSPAPRYDLWEISVDGGVLFVHATTDRTGIELGQGGFEVVSDASDTDLGELVAELSAAERLPDPDAP